MTKSVKKKATAKAAAPKKSGPSAAEWLEQLLDDDACSAAGKKLMKEPPAIRAAIVELVAKALKKDPDATEHLWALANIDADDHVLDALIAYASKGKGDIRETAIGIIGANEKKPKRVVPVLLDALADKNEDIVSEAASGLADYADPALIPALAQALTKVQKNPRWAQGVAGQSIFDALGASALKGKAKDHDAVVDVLTANLAPKDRYGALHAFAALVAMGARATRAVPALEKAAAGKDLYLSTLARHALGAITGSYKPHLAALEAAAKSKDAAEKAVAQAALRDAKQKKTK